MNSSLSPNTQAILLLTAPLIAGRSTSIPDLLTLGEYKRLARHLREMQCQPADLLSTESAELLHACQSIIREDRLQRLLGRGFLLSQVIERWKARAIWVVSRADTDYPRRLKARLREDAPAVLYGCGDVALLETGGFAVVGSRHVDDVLIDYTMAVGRLSAKAGKTLVSGAAKGIDQAAMCGALEAGGTAIGVLADSLEKKAMNREYRNRLIEGQLLLISPYDPSAGFNVGNAMQRNKLIYALADASLVVNADFNKGGTWAGATEQLDKLRWVPVYVRSTGELGEGLVALRQKGALSWPNPQDPDAFAAVFDVPMPSTSGAAVQSRRQQTKPTGPPNKPLQEPAEPTPESMPTPTAQPENHPVTRGRIEPTAAVPESEIGPADIKSLSEKPPHPTLSPTGARGNQIGSKPLSPTGARGNQIGSKPLAPCPADAVFATVRKVLQQLLTNPMKDADVAATLQVSTPQARTWLQRLVDEGVLEKHKKPVAYVVKNLDLLESKSNVNVE